jgi:hypothetical protein
VDQVITGLMGIRPRSDDTLHVNPLAPEEWDYFALEGVAYHGHDLTILWDRNGTRYEKGAGLAVLLDGREVARRREMGEIRVAIPGPVVPEPEVHLVNYAVHNDGGPYPLASASSSHPLYPPFYAVDGNRWYHPSPPNRWVAAGVAEADRGGDPDTGMDPDRVRAGARPAGGPLQDPGTREAWFQVDFGQARPLTQVQLYFLDDQSGPAREAVGEEENSGFPMAQAQVGLPVRPPESFRLEIEREGEWVEVPGQDRAPLQPAGRRANRIRFPRVEGKAIRVFMTLAPGATVGLTELEAWGPVSSPGEADVSPNLALARPGDEFPSVSASFTYEGDPVGQAVDGRIALTRYSRNRWSAYSSPNSSDWLQVDFGEARQVRQVELYLYGDGRGLAAPVAYQIEIWDGNQWVPAPEEGRSPKTPLAWARNVVELSPVETERVRVVFQHALPAASAVSELRILGP